MTVVNLNRNGETPSSAFTFAEALDRAYDQLCRRRKALERFAPIDSRPLTEIDKQLVEHPLLQPEMEFKIRWRSIYLLWQRYQEADVRKSFSACASCTAQCQRMNKKGSGSCGGDGWTILKKKRSRLAREPRASGAMYGRLTQQQG